MRRRDHNIFANATSLLICGLLAGVVVAAAAFPAVAMSGLAAKAGGETFGNLPGELKQQTAPQVSYVYASDGKTPLATFYEEFRSDVALKDISKNMQNAIIAAEDHKFFEHNGVDVKGIARAFVNNNAGKAQQGASTLTMQYVRMSIAYSATRPQEVVDATADTPKRKLSEMKYALQIEKQLNKQQILERYLNIAPFGNGAWGIYAASKVYFNKLPKDLTIPESALLAGLVKAPTSFNPTTASGNPRAKDRRDYVLQQMRKLNLVTQEEHDKAKATKVGRKSWRVSANCETIAKNNWGFFCDYFLRWWRTQPAFGANAFERERRLKTGGYRIVASLDPQSQAAAREAITDEIKDTNKNALLIAGVEPGTGHVRALATNRKFKLPDPDKPNPLSSDPAKRKAGVRATYPNTTNPIITGSADVAGYQAGSVFKMFTMVAALEKGYPLSWSYNTPKRYVSNYRIDPSSPAACNGPFYCPGNANDGAGGVHNMWTGFGASINTFFVPLQEQVGAENVVDVARRFGVQFRAPEDARLAADANQWGAFTLGVSSSTPLDMANAFATLAGDGKYCTPTPVESIKTHDGETLDVGKPHCVQATTPDVARAALDAARCPVGDRAQLGSCAGRATARQSRSAVGHPIFGKSGTTDKDKTASLIIGTASLVMAGYLVNPDWPNHNDRMSHGIVNPAVWNAMGDAMKGKPEVEFKKPTGDKLTIGDQRRIPNVTCDSIDDAMSELRDAGFTPSRGATVTSECPAGTAAGTNPDGRTVKGGAVTVQISDGKGGQPEPGDPQQPGVQPGGPGGPGGPNGRPRPGGGVIFPPPRR